MRSFFLNGNEHLQLNKLKILLNDNKLDNVDKAEIISENTNYYTQPVVVFIFIHFVFSTFFFFFVI